MRIPDLILSAALVALTSCAPSDPAPVHTAAVTFDSKTQKYQITQVDLTTITDLATLTGSVAQIVGGAKVVIDENDPLLNAATTNEDSRKAILKDPGGSVRASFIKSGDVQWPADFHSENMVTTYYNFERSFMFYSKFGWTLEQAQSTHVYYFPSLIETASSKDPETDNAAFFPLIDGFLILPFDQIQSIPLPMNLGIIGHEYSHFMVNTRVYDSQPLPDAYGDLGGYSAGIPSPGANLLKSLDEGFADLFGTGVTCGDDFSKCDPNFIAASLPDEATSRNLAGTHCLDQTLNTELTTDSLQVFTSAGHQYDVGTVLSSAIWRAANDPAVVGALGQAGAIEKAMQTVYDALDDTDPNNPGLKQILIQIKNLPQLFTIDWMLADDLVRHAADPKLGTALCQAFMDRLGTDAALGVAQKDRCDQACVAGNTQFPSPPYNCICACHQGTGSPSPSFPAGTPFGDCQ